jgi:hypothetical protein
MTTKTQFKVYDTIPDTARQTVRFGGLKEASILGTFRMWHQCPTCEGWIAGSAERRVGKETEQPLSPGSEFTVTGPKPVSFHCRRCGSQIASKHP